MPVEDGADAVPFWACWTSNEDGDSDDGAQGHMSSSRSSSVCQRSPDRCMVEREGSRQTNDHGPDNEYDGNYAEDQVSDNWDHVAQWYSPHTSAPAYTQQQAFAGDQPSAASSLLLERIERMEARCIARIESMSEDIIRRQDQFDDTIKEIQRDVSKLKTSAPLNSNY